MAGWLGYMLKTFAYDLEAAIGHQDHVYAHFKNNNSKQTAIKSVKNHRLRYLAEIRNRKRQQRLNNSSFDTDDNDNASNGLTKTDSIIMDIMIRNHGNWQKSFHAIIKNKQTMGRPINKYNVLKECCKMIQNDVPKVRQASKLPFIDDDFSYLYKSILPRNNQAEKPDAQVNFNRDWSFKCASFIRWFNTVVIAKIPLKMRACYIQAPVNAGKSTLFDIARRKIPCYDFVPDNGWYALSVCHPLSVCVFSMFCFFLIS